MDNSTNTQPNDIEDDLTNWTSLGEWKFTATSAKKKQHNIESAVPPGNIQVRHSPTREKTSDMQVGIQT
jgi:hypothetical protein